MGKRGGASVVLLAALVTLLGVLPARAAQNGRLYAFGNNNYGELGNAANSGSTNPNPTPALVAMPGQSGPVTQIAAGCCHTLVLTSSAQLFAFGYNFEGQLGNPTNNNTYNANPTPAHVTLPGQSGQITRIAAGGRHSLALTSTGQLYAFGYNWEGQVGNSTNNGTYNPNLPALVSLPGRVGPVTQIAAGTNFSLALTSSGQLYGFGENQYGELGSTTNNGTYNATPPALITLPGQSGHITQIDAGSSDSYVTTSSGQLFAFGINEFGELGNSTNVGTGTPNPTPTLVTLPGQSGVITQIAAGASHNLALTSTGQLFAWGYNFEGQLGSTTNNNTYNANPTPALVTLPGRSGQIIRIAAGDRDSLVLTSTGQLYSFGYNAFGQLGRTANTGTYNPNPPALVPITIPAGMTIDALSYGSQADHTLVALAPLSVPPAVPKLSGVKVSPRKLSRTGRKVNGRCVKQTLKNKKLKPCSLKLTLKVGFKVNVRARVTVVLTRTTTGRTVKGRCVKLTMTNKKLKRCTLTQAAGSITQNSSAGTGTVTIGPRKLLAGKYTVTVIARANGRTSTPLRASFTVR